MSVNKRKWLWKGEKNGWREYRLRYYIIVAIFSLPGAIYNIYKQHNGDGFSSLGCNPGYEELGGGMVVFFTELLPIVVGFCTNVFVFFQVRARMAAKAFPLSVRKKRRKIMYHYIIVCIICWTPTMIFYIAELSGLHSELLEVISRISLYLTGFFNFLVFGLQDPHLKRSLMVAIYFFSSGMVGLKHTPVDKSVMFGGDLSDNADVSKDKKNIYRYHKLTKEDKVALYSARPDLDPKTPYTRSRSTSGKKLSNNITESLLTEHERMDCSGEEFNEGDSKDDIDEDVESPSGSPTKIKTKQQPSDVSNNGIADGIVYTVTSPTHSAPHLEKEDCEYIQYQSDTESSSDEDDDEDEGLQTPIPELFAIARSPESSV